jgi:hypothetical protein
MNGLLGWFSVGSAWDTQLAPLHYRRAGYAKYALREGTPAGIGRFLTIWIVDVNRPGIYRTVVRQIPNKQPVAAAFIRNPSGVVTRNLKRLKSDRLLKPGKPARLPFEQIVDQRDLVADEFQREVSVGGLVERHMRVGFAVLRDHLHAGFAREMHDAREHETGVENAEYIIAGEIDGGKFATNYVVLIDIY